MHCNSSPLFAQSRKYLFLICIEQFFVISVFQLPWCFRSWQRRVEDEQFPSTFCSLFQRHHIGTFIPAGLRGPHSHPGGSGNSGCFLQAPLSSGIHLQALQPDGISPQGNRAFSLRKQHSSTQLCCLSHSSTFSRGKSRSSSLGDFPIGHKHYAMGTTIQILRLNQIKRKCSWTEKFSSGTLVFHTIL